MLHPTSLREEARATRYHQRRAIRRIGQDKPDDVRPTTLASLIAMGYVVEIDGSMGFTRRGREVHDTLETLGWFPPEEKRYPILPDDRS